MSKDQYGQQYPQQPAYGQQYGAQTTHTTVVVRHEGCCSLRGRVQWVAGYNLVFGLINLISGIIYATPSYNTYDSYFNTSALAGIGITLGSTMIAGGIVLLLGLSQGNPQIFMAWFFFTGLHVALIVGLMGYNIYIIANLTKHGYGLGMISFGVASGVISILIEVACILTVVGYKKQL